jgi:hypothetical protein
MKTPQKKEAIMKHQERVSFAKTAKTPPHSDQREWGGAVLCERHPHAVCMLFAHGASCRSLFCIMRPCIQGASDAEEKLTNFLHSTLLSAQTGRAAAKSPSKPRRSSYLVFREFS